MLFRTIIQFFVALTEIAKIFETKYRDLVPAFMILLDCQDKIQSTLKTGDRKLKKVQDALINLETNILEASVTIFYELKESL